jgi:hypothetical protein
MLVVVNDFFTLDDLTRVFVDLRIALKNDVIAFSRGGNVSLRALSCFEDSI